MILLGQYWGDEQSFKVYCDSCDECYEELAESMQDFCNGIQLYGWSIEGTDRNSNHFCRKCSETYS